MSKFHEILFSIDCVKRLPVENFGYVLVSRVLLLASMEMISVVGKTIVMIDFAITEIELTQPALISRFIPVCKFEEVLSRAQNIEPLHSNITSKFPEFSQFPEFPESSKFPEFS